MRSAAGGEVVTLSIPYIDKLQRANADDLAFYPLTTLAKAVEDGHVISCEDNGEAAGYLWFGAVRGGYDVTIYQACVDYESRRRYLGWEMVAQLVKIGNAGGATGIRLKCASSAESNEFWQAAGFYCTRVTNGGIKRGRDINHYRTDLQPGLFTLPLVTPSGRPIDLGPYNALKRAGVAMPSRFSRSHYGEESA
jgi:ribosomal protein S18 acetylase RimI-like enzyme